MSTITLVLQKHPLIKWSVGCQLLDWIKLFFLVFWLIFTLETFHTRKLILSSYFFAKHNAYWPHLASQFCYWIVMVLCFWFGKYVTRRNPFLDNVFILYLLKTPENIWFFGSWRGYKFENWLALGRYVLFIKKVIFACGGHSIITLSQNDQNLNPLSLSLVVLVRFGITSPLTLTSHPPLIKIVNCVIF